MARHSFGGDLASWVFTVGAGNTAVVLGGASITFWTGKTGGTQYTDLAMNADGSGTVSAITSQDGTGGTSLGAFPLFYGPPTTGGAEILAMWASANGGPRFLILANDLPASVAQALAAVGALDTTVSNHLAAANPHGTELDDLDNVDVATVADGQLLAYDQASDTWKPVTVGGVSGTVLLAGAQTITGTKTFNTSDPATSRIIVLASGTQTADLLQLWSSASQSVGGVSQKTLSADALGRLRLLSPSTASVLATLRAATGQTADLFQQLNSAGTAVAWMDSIGRWRAPNLGALAPFTVSGDVAAGTGKHKLPNPYGVDLTIRAVMVTVGTAPTGAALTVDVNLNGTTIFANQANRPTVPAGQTISSRVTSMDTTNFPAGSTLTIDVDTVGSTVPGADLVVVVLAY